MGLLDINERADTVIDAEYFKSNSWSEHLKSILHPVNGCIPTTSWMKLHCVKVTWNNKTDNVLFWVRYDEYNSTVYNVRTGERFTTTNVLILEMVISNWQQSIQDEWHKRRERRNI